MPDISGLRRRLLSSRAVRAMGVAATLTVGARIVGLASQALVIGRYGTGATLDGFFLALIVPTLIAVPLAGAFELAVPSAYASALSAEAADASILRSRVLRLGVVLGIVVAAVATLLSPVLVGLSGIAADSEVLDSARVAARYVYPGTAFRVISAAATGILIGMGRISAPVLAKVANPAMFIVFLLVSGSTDIRLVALANLVGDAGEALIMLALLFRHVEHSRQSPIDALP